MSNEWWRGCVIYQVYPRSYCDNSGSGVGDLKGITAKLDHIAALGVDAIWISPFFKSPMKDFGYDVSDYCDVAPVFGNLNDFQALLDYAHTVGLKVLIDQVYSHSSDEHDWFKQSRTSRDNDKADWYVWADPQADGTPPNNWISYFGGPSWTWNSTREQYYLHHFLSTQPSLNLHNPKVREAVKKAASFWLDMGVDGFRLDAVQTYIHDKQLRSNPALGPDDEKPLDIPASNPLSYQKKIYSNTMAQPGAYEWIEEFRAHVDQWGDICLLAEVGGEESDFYAAQYVQTGKRFHCAYSFGFLGSTLTKDDIVKVVLDTEKIIEDGWMCWSTSNHDFERAVTRINPYFTNKGDITRYLVALILSLRGSAGIYQGEELGLPQASLAFEDLVDPYDIMLYPEHVGRDGCRTPMPWIHTAPNAGFSNTNTKPWLPIPQEHVGLSVDLQENDENSTLNHQRRLIQWKKQQPALKTGSFKLIETQNEIFCFIRKEGEQSIFCAFNTSDKPQTLDKSEIPNCTPFDEVNNNVTSNDNNLSFEAYGYGFFEIV